ncbi:MAG: hypothetical protein QM699_03685 [Amaricoccus sp.]|uniref:hypothetical protein n=1 Tax=Amaricoccus sp. TaxID=1872485 RepID=UPI0039E522BB
MTGVAWNVGWPAPAAARRLSGVRRRPRVALLVEPRFPGGTSGAVAAEIRALAPHVNLSVMALATSMFRDRPVHPEIARALDDAGLSLRPAPPVVRADAIVLHNPSALKFETALAPRLSAARTIVVTHENFTRPGGHEGFDVGHCLGLVAGRIAGGDRLLAPVSAANRRTVADWLTARAEPGWTLAGGDWPNILDPAFVAPTDRPRDRRGRHSRPGPEKFPGLAALRAQFPPHAERCAILGADAFLADREAVPGHWELLPFGTMPVAEFLAGIDFLVHFTNPLWRESFGRAIAEAIIAGKLVITDPDTAASFGPGVIGDDGRGVDAIVARHVADPVRYAATVRRAQADLARHRPEAVVPRLLALLDPQPEARRHAAL